MDEDPMTTPPDTQPMSSDDSTEPMEQPPGPPGPPGPTLADEVPAPPKAKSGPKKPKAKKPKKPKEVVEAPPVPEPPTVVSAAPAWRRRSGLVLAAVAVVVIVGLAVALTLTSVRLHRADSNNTYSSALSAGRLYATDLASYDYRHLDQDFGLVTSHSSAAFAKTFTKSSNALRPILTKYRATAKATVVAAGVTSASSSRAVVLVLLKQTVTNTVVKKGPTTEDTRVSITLVRGHGQWIIEQVTLL
jgi:Mce-associated membrane protein